MQDGIIWTRKLFILFLLVGEGSIIIIIMFNFILAKLSWMMAVSGHFKDYIFVGLASDC